MLNSPSTLPAILAMVQEKLTYIVLPTYVVLGIFGNSFCIFYFLQRSQRTSSCAFYLLLAAITNMFAVTFGVATSVLNTALPLASTILAYCKLRMYINHSSIFIGRMFTTLASIDTYTMSSPRHVCRMFSQRSVAIKCAIAVFICCPVIAVHIPIMNTIVGGQCVMTGVYSLIFAIYQMFIAGIFPPVTMIIFSCLAYCNMKISGIQNDNTVSRTKKQQQRQLVHMVTTQITVYIISAELVPITTVYKQLTSTYTKSPDQKAIEAFIIFIASNFLLYFNTWAAFFIYYATSSSFRIAFIRMFKKIYRVQPIETTMGNRTASTARN